MVEVPAENLNPETLISVIESFVLREGTDYGAAEVSLETKIRQVLSQIEAGQVKIVFDEQSESLTLLKVPGSLCGSIA